MTPVDSRPVIPVLPVKIRDKVNFILNIVTNSKKELVQAFAGDLEQAFLAGTKLVGAHAVLSRITKETDIGFTFHLDSKDNATELVAVRKGKA